MTIIYSGDIINCNWGKNFDAFRIYTDTRGLRCEPVDTSLQLHTLVVNKVHRSTFCIVGCKF